MPFKLLMQAKPSDGQKVVLHPHRLLPRRAYPPARNAHPTGKTVRKAWSMTPSLANEFFSCFIPHNSTNSLQHLVRPTCSSGYRCEESTVEGLFVCCTPSSIMERPLGERKPRPSSIINSTIASPSSSDWVILEGRKR